MYVLLDPASFKKKRTYTDDCMIGPGSRVTTIIQNFYCVTGLDPASQNMSCRA